MTFSVEKFSKALHQLTPSQQFLIAYSGGLDSHVLLHSLVSLRQQYAHLQLRAIHINHHLNASAAKWAAHCQQICQDWQVDFLLRDVQIDLHDDRGIEAAARTERYAIFSELLRENECLLTAHQQTDQAETVLLQLFRGAGVKGLSSMPPKIPFAKGCLLRPLLSFSRDELYQYAIEQQLRWLEDSSNIDVRFNRNFIRHKVMPVLLERWPSLPQTLARSAKNFAEADELLTTLAEQDFSAIQTSELNQILIPPLLNLPESQQLNVLRYWLTQLNLPIPSRVKLQQLQHDLLHCRFDAMAKIGWKGAEVRRYRNKLYAMSPLPSHDPTVILNWDLTQPLQLPAQLGQLQSNLLDHYKIHLPNRHHITIRFRHGGEKIKLAGRTGSHSLKKLFQEWEIPFWQRDRIPLLYWRNELVAVLGYSVAEGYIKLS